MEENNFLSGGVSLFHSVVNGKHQYEVKQVLTSTPKNFTRKGDKLLMINNTETQDLPPNLFVEMLCSESAKLTVHQASIDSIEEEETHQDSGCIKACFKEYTTLHFSLDMVEESCLDEEEKYPREVEEECSDIEDDLFANEELLFVSMRRTSVAVVNARGCDSENPCSACGGSGCSLNEIIVATKHCEVSSVCGEYIIKHIERNGLLIQSLLQTTLCTTNVQRRQSLASPGSEKITIYYYESNILKDLPKGSPVVMNFTGTNIFLKCVQYNEKVFLRAECYEKVKLQKICKDEPATWPFVFYMTSMKDNCRRFESAAFPGWFIHTKPNVVCVDKPQKQTDMGSSFYFVIHEQKSTN